VNYGGVGGVIGHEMSHAFDDQGAKTDAKGAQRDWWDKADVARFKAMTARLAGQYSRYEPIPSSHVNGEMTLGENIGDLGGLNIALEAYHIALHEKPAPILNGTTGDQRVFPLLALELPGAEPDQHGEAGDAERRRPDQAATSHSLQHRSLNPGRTGLAPPCA